MTAPLVLFARNLAGLPGVRHGFSTRVANDPASAEPFDLRLRPEHPARSQRMRERFLEAVGLEGAALVTLGQTHEDRIYDVADDRPLPTEPPQGFDAVVTARADVAVAIGTADCLPILLADVHGRAVGAVHAGWRSAALGLPALTVRRLIDGFDVKTRELRAALGPSIGSCCFEVGEEVVEGLAARIPEPAQWVVRAPGRKPHVDLARACTLALIEAGLAPEAIECVPGCTRCDARRFFSFRREGAATGRQLAVVGLGCGGSATSPLASASSTSA
ncbi:MAG: peptidoglycan editing factor PgeF [bacterium]